MISRILNVLNGTFLYKNPKYELTKQEFFLKRTFYVGRFNIFLMGFCRDFKNLTFYMENLCIWVPMSCNCIRRRNTRRRSTKDCRNTKQNLTSMPSNLSGVTLSE